eukprot:TRINITY_DN12623_c0_g1_i1.p1 TRINITY_DN12623_c0_g1~~TRINITY_DN12623_c0_g1_i1.p1  ORF type:complete len:152 (-),score=66.03 TRINITY_DN12623_c0_g1_i1:118-522(-)
MLMAKFLSNPEFFSAAIFASDSSTITSTFEKPFTPEIVKTVFTVFDDYDKAFENGVRLDRIYEVHRFYDSLIYGRTTEPSPDSVGFVLQKVAINGKDFVVAVTYIFPEISPKIVQKLRNVTAEPSFVELLQVFA